MHPDGALPAWCGPTRVALAAAVSLLLARRGLARGSLAPSGAAAAALVGFVTLAADVVLGALLIGFYVTGSAATRHGSALKQQFDAEHRPGGGRRDASQVLATAGLPALLAVRWLLRYGLPGGWARLDYVSDAGGTRLFVGALAALAMVAGDTWASELGILSSRDPVSVLRCARVPRGTNGGVSAWGTLMSLAGGASIGAMAVAVGWTQDVLEEALLTDVGAHGGGHVPYAVPQAVLVLVGAAAGGLGSLLDSLLGAALQATYVDIDSGRITSRLPAPPVGAESGAAAAVGSGGGGGVVLLRGAGYVLLGGADSDNWRRRYRERLLGAPGVAAAAAAAAADQGAPSNAHTTTGSDVAVSGRGAAREVGGSSSGLRRRGVAAAPEAPCEAPPLLRLVRVCGWDVLSNEQVNLVASALTAACAVWGTRAAVAAVWGPAAAGLAGGEHGA